MYTCIAPAGSELVWWVGANTYLFELETLSYLLTIQP